MTYRVSFLVAAASAMLALPAQAAPVFMLQFGSFETRAEADARLSELKTKHAGVLGQAPLSIREVNLPPDNLTVYRTQAGPVNTRAEAQSVCSQLASNGDECYVVETAMLAPSTPATTQVATAAPAMSTPPATPVEPTKDTATPAPTAESAVTPPEVTAVTEASNAAPEAAPPVALQPLPVRDASNMAAMSRVSPTTATANAETTSQASPQLMAAMDQAAAEQNNSVANAPTPPGAKKEGSFWSRLNPFSDDEDEIEMKRPTPPAPQRDFSEAAPVESISASSTMPAPPPVVVQQNAPPAVIVPMETTTPPPVVVQSTAPVVMQPITPSMMNDPAPMRLPPPPEPTNPADRAALAAGNMPTPAPMPMPVIVPESTGTVPAPMAAADGTVRVGEAQRVPLTETMVPPPPAVASVPGPAVAQPTSVPAVSLRPSSTLGQKTLWAQIGQFADAQAALAFWEGYRRQHPDFPVVRVRVTTPYQAMQRGIDKVNLRVGPFAKSESINNLCTTVPREQLRCGQITDLGVASSIGGSRNGYLPGSRYRR